MLILRLVVTPAQAGFINEAVMDSRFRGNDKTAGHF
jgi:hypothetical protein